MGARHQQGRSEGPWGRGPGSRDLGELAGGAGWLWAEAPGRGQSKDKDLVAPPGESEELQGQGAGGQRRRARAAPGAPVGPGEGFGFYSDPDGGWAVLAQEGPGWGVSVSLGAPQGEAEPRRSHCGGPGSDGAGRWGGRQQSRKEELGRKKRCAPGFLFNCLVSFSPCKTKGSQNQRMPFPPTGQVVTAPQSQTRGGVL